VLVPGEGASRAMARRRAEGVPLAEATWARIRRICDDLALAPPAPLRG
jgi:LDH2 family malate/lactate/ureidoglycolate dehydrogenase